MSYIGNSPGVASQRVVTTFTATSNQTTFTPTSGYTLGYCDVYFNGVKLVAGDDYTAADGVSVVLASGAAANDVVEVVAHFPRGLSDGYLKAEADARYPRVDVNTQSLTSTQKGNARTNIGAQADLGYTPVNKAGDTMTGPLKMDGTAINIVSGNSHSLRFYKDNTDYNAGNASWAIYGAYSDGTMYFTRYGGNPVNQTPADLLLLKGNGDMALTTGNLIVPSGKGIDFSASANAGGATNEVLDDYEIGTFTPYFSNSLNQNITSNYDQQQGWYQKVGNIVHFSVYVQSRNAAAGSWSWLNGGGNATPLYIGGLPFTSVSSNSAYPSIACGYFANWTGWTASYTPMGYVEAGTNTVLMTYAIANGITAITAQYINVSASAILISGTYRTAS